MKKRILLATAIVVGLVITSIASSVSVNKATVSDTQEENDIVAHYMVVKSQPITKLNLEKSKQPSTFSSAQVTGGDYDDYHPSVAGSPAGGFFAMAESSTDGSVWQPTLYGSTDGITWQSIASFSYDNAQYTDLDQNAYGTYGTFGAPPDNSGYIFLVNGEDPQSSVYWDFSSQNFNEFSNNHIACYTYEGPENDSGTWNWGGISMVGFNGHVTPNIEGCPFVFYQSSSAGNGLIGWLSGNVGGCEHVGSTMDLAKNYLYTVYDRNPGTGIYELLLRKDDFGTWLYNSQYDYWYHKYLTSKHITNTTVSLKYPSVAAAENNVVVACQKDNDIAVFYSTNGFSSYTEVPIETSASYPEVATAGGGAAFVITYIKDNVLYFRTSTDGGATWSGESIVSDNQVKTDYRAANLDEYNGNVYGVWEDTRGTNIDVYFDLIYEFQNNPPGAPTIKGSASGDINRVYPYTFNAVDPDGNKVKYIIDWGDGKSDTTALNPSGTDVTVSHTWTTKGTYTIKAKAQDSVGALGPEGTLKVKMPRNRALTLRFLDYFSHAFPFLWKLLG